MVTNCRQWILLLALFSLVLLAARVGAQETNIHVAYAGPIAGPDASSGRSLIQSIQLYFDQINAAGGIDGRKLILDLYDDENIPAVAKQKAKAIVASSAVAVIGHWYSSISLAVKDIYDAARIPVLTFSVDVNVTLGTDVFFRTVQNNDLEGRFLASYASKVLKKQRIGILYGDQTYEVGLKDVFLQTLRKLAADVIFVRQYQTGVPHTDPSWAALGEELSEYAETDLILLSSQAPDAAMLVRLLRDQDSKSVILGPGTLSDNAFVKGFEHLPGEQARKGRYTDGVYLAAPLLFDVANAKAQVFKSDYEQLYREPASPWGAYAYDNAMILVEAFRATGITGRASVKSAERKQVIAYLKALNAPEFAIEGVTGLNYFDENGDARKPIAIGQFKNGQIISAMAQLNGVRSVKDIYNLDEMMTRGSVLYIEGEHMYQTNVVYTGVKIWAVTDLDIKHFTCTVDFDLWFRMSVDLDTADIVFSSAQEPVTIGKPVEEKRQGNLIYRRYKVTGKFKIDPPGWYREFGDHIIGLSFRHNHHSRNTLVYVADLVGMGLNPRDTVRHRVLDDDVINKSSGWKPKRVHLYQDITTVDAKGDPDYLNAPDALVEFSRLNVGVWLQPRGIAVRRTLNYASAWVLTGVCAGLLLLVWYLGRRLFSEKKDILFLVQAPLTCLLLLSIETLFIVKFVDAGKPVEVVDSIVRGFDILWWVVPAFLINLAIQRFVLLQIERRSGRQIPNIIPRAIGSILYLLAVFGIIAYVFDEKITSLLATSGLVAMIVGLAIQINIANIFSGIIINIEHPFRIGDWIQIGDHEEGQVVDITWRSTRLRTRQGNLLSVPNSQSAEAVMRNYSHPYDIIWGWFTVHVASTYEPERVLKILNDAVLSVWGIRKEPVPEAIYLGLSEWASDYMVMYCYADYANKQIHDEAVWKRVWNHLNRAGISPAMQNTEILFHGQQDRGDTAMQPAIVLSEVDVFKPFSEKGISFLADRVHRRNFAKDTHVVKQGDSGDSLFMVVEGVVSVRLNTDNGQELEIARLGSGDFFGEMSLLTGEPRSADVVTLTPSLFFEITKADLLPIMEQEAAAIEPLSEILAKRQTEIELRLEEHGTEKSLQQTLTRRLIGQIKSFFQIA